MIFPATFQPLLPVVHERRFQSVENLDEYFTHLYSYFHKRGLISVITAELCSLISLGFTIFISLFLIACVNWTLLMECHDENSCSNDIRSYVKDPFFTNGYMLGFFSLLYTILLGGFWLRRLSIAIVNIKESMNMERVYR